MSLFGILQTCTELLGNTGLQACLLPAYTIQPGCKSVTFCGYDLKSIFLNIIKSRPIFKLSHKGVGRFDWKMSAIKETAII